MYISKLKIKNFKCFDEVEINFDPNFNLIVGKNNSGKSTIFEALRLWQLAIQQFYTKRTGKIGDGENNIGFYKKYQFEPLELSDLSFLRIDSLYNILNHNTKIKFEGDELQFDYNNTFTIEVTFSNIDGASSSVPIEFRPSDRNVLRCSIKFESNSNDGKFEELKSMSHKLSKVMGLRNNATFINRIRLAYIPPKFTLPSKEVLFSRDNSFISEKLVTGESNLVIRNIIHHWAEFSYQVKTKSKSDETIKKVTTALNDIGINPEIVRKDFHNKIKPFIENALKLNVYPQTNPKSKFLEEVEEGLNKIVEQTFYFKSVSNPIENSYLQITDVNKKTEISQLGSGTINILNILTVLNYNEESIKGDATKCNILLLDEPDSHLQFNLQNKLFEYLEKVSEDDGKQIFIVTHNSSLISQFDSILYIKNNQNVISPISIDDYLENELKDIDIHHYKVMKDLNQAKKEKEEVQKQLNKVVKPVLFCEGSTDVTILKEAFNKLYDKTTFFDGVLDIKGGGGASKVNNHLQYNSNSEICIIGLFDRDKEGKEHFERLQKNGNGFTLVESSNFHCIKPKSRTNALTIPIPSDRNKTWFDENTFIEYLFSDETLEKSGVELERLDYMNFKTIKSKVGKDFKKDCDIEKNKIISKLNKLTKSDFKNFIPLFEKIAEIIDFKLPHTEINA
jgi:predicted ATP-dependent endonuclease of OLD family